MPSRQTLAVVLLALVGPLSLAGKLAPPHTPHDAAMPSGAQAQALLDAGELVRVASRRVIDGAAYSLAIYRHPEPARCAGLLYLMPMATNAEASALLRHASSPRTVDHFFVLGGELSDRYPTWRHWMLRTRARLERAVGQPARMPVVHGVATTDRCIEARQMGWSRLRT